MLIKDGENGAIFWIAEQSAQKEKKWKAAEQPKIEIEKALAVFG